MSKHLIDFTDIGAGNIGGQDQDQFELFARDFFIGMDFKIIMGPGRGADRGKDMVVEGSFEKNIKPIKWLVSCKHNANSKKRDAVNPSDEQNITQRLKLHNCTGFIGMYSTVPSQFLVDLVHAQGFPYRLLDHRIIEGYMLSKTKLSIPFLQYFPKSFERYKQYIANNPASPVTSSTSKPPQRVKKKTTVKKKTKTNQRKDCCLTEEDYLRISKDALIIIELEKIKDRFAEGDWTEKATVITELHKYSDHTDLVVAEHVFKFLDSIADLTKSGMPEEVATSILSLIIGFFPYSEEEKHKTKIEELGIDCANIAFSMCYDVCIYTKNYKVLMYGLTILKYVYKKGKASGMKTLIKRVEEVYSELERNLERPERNDLADSKEFLKAFKADMEEGTLSFPPLPEHLYKLIYKD